MIFEKSTRVGNFEMLFEPIKKLIKRPINVRPNELNNQIEHNKLFEDTGFISEDAVELEIDPLPR